MSEPRAPYNRPPNVPEDWEPTSCAGCRVKTWYDPEVARKTIAAGKPFVAVCSKDCTIASALALARSVASPEPPLEMNHPFQLRRDVWARFDGKHMIIAMPEESTAHVSSGGVVEVHLTPTMMATLFWLNRRVVDTFESWVVDFKDLDS